MSPTAAFDQSTATEPPPPVFPLSPISDEFPPSPKEDCCHPASTSANAITIAEITANNLCFFIKTSFFSRKFI